MRARTGSMRSVAIAVVLAAVFNLVAALPANATGTDVLAGDGSSEISVGTWAAAYGGVGTTHATGTVGGGTYGGYRYAGGPSGPCTGGGGIPSFLSLIADGDDCSQVGTGATGGSDTSVGHFWIAWTFSHAPEAVASFRVCGYQGGSAAGDWIISTQNGTWGTDNNVWTVQGTPASFTAIGGGNSCGDLVLGAAITVTAVMVTLAGVAAPGAGLYVNTLSAFGPAPPGSVGAYIRNLFVDRSSLSGVHIQWQWIAGYTGSWSIRDNSTAGCAVTYATGTNPSANAIESTFDGVFGSCAGTNAQGPWHLHIADTGIGVVADFDIAAGADGTVPLPTAAGGDPSAGAPRIIVGTACKNATANFCSGSTPVGWTRITYAVRGANVADQATVYLAPLLPDGTEDVAVFVDSGVTENGDVQYHVLAGGIPDGAYHLRAYNGSGTDQWLLLVAAGSTTVIGETEPTISLCGPLDVRCAVGAEIAAVTCQGLVSPGDCWLSRLVVPRASVIGSMLQGVITAIEAREPFATFVAVKAKVDQVAALTASTSTSCLTIGLHAAPGAPAVSTPVGICFSVVTSLSSWPAIRTMEGVAVYGWMVMVLWDWVRGRSGDQGPTDAEMFGTRYGG